MKKSPCLTSVIFAISLCICTAKASETDMRFTPPKIDQGSINFSYEEWLARPLTLLHEPSLWAKFNDNRRTHSYRISKVGSFSLSVVARLEVSVDSSANLYVVNPNYQKLEELAKNGASRDLLLTMVRRKFLSKISAEQVSKLVHLLQKSGFWTDKIDQTERRDLKPAPNILDGTTYFIEASFNEKYKLVIRHGCWMENDLKSIVRNIADLAKVDSLADGC